MATQDDYTRITLRMPKDLHERLSGIAEDTSKSMNAEIIGRLEASVFASEAPEELIPASKAREIAETARRRLSAIVEARTISAINKAAATGRTMAIAEFQDLQLDEMTTEELIQVYGDLYDKLDAAGYHLENDGNDVLLVYLSPPKSEVAE